MSSKDTRILTLFQDILNLSSLLLLALARNKQIFGELAKLGQSLEGVDLSTNKKNTMPKQREVSSLSGGRKNRFASKFPISTQRIIVDSKVLGWSNKVYYHRVEFEEWHPITSPLSAWRRDQTFLQMFFFHKSAERVG